MMRKSLFIFIIALFIFPSVFAATETNTFVLTFDYNSGVQEKGIAAGYDANNRLVAAKLCDIQIGEKVCKAELEMALENKNIRLYFPKTNTTIKEFTSIEVKTGEIIEPKPTPTPTPTPQPGENDPQTNPSVSPYPTELDAANAYMEVVSATAVSKDNVDGTELKAYYQGKEITFFLNDDFTLESAPLFLSDLTKAPLSELKPGDIIYCSANLNRQIVSVELIFRAPDSDVIMQDEDFGTNFEKLYSLGSTVTNAAKIPIAIYGADNYAKKQYAFGLIKESKSGKYMLISNKEGLAAKDIDINLTPNTVVYVYDASKSKNKMSIGSVADIEKSELDSASLDDDDNIIHWNTTDVHNYALVRMTQGVALEVSVYLNYNL